MRKNYFFILLTGFLLAGCAKQNLQELSEPKGGPGDKTSPMYAGDGKYDVLGHGYNVVGEYGNASATRFQIIDIDRLEREQPSRVLADKINEQKGLIISGENAYEYLKNKTAHIYTDFSLFKLGKLFFKTSITGDYRDSSAFSSKYVYSDYEHKVIRKRVKINGDVNLLINYLKPSFLADVQNYSPQDFVKFYGTHILIDGYLGGKLEAKYRAETSDSHRKTAASAGVDVAVKLVFKLNTTYSHSQSETINNKHTSFSFRTIGGEPSKSVVGDNDDKSPNLPARFSNWQSSVSDENSVLIDIAQDGLIPVYELIADPGKKAEIKDYVLRYLEANGIKATPDPVYVYYNDSQNGRVYTIDADQRLDQHGWRALGVNFYAFTSQVPGTEPIHHWYNPRTHDRVYTINRNDYPYSQNGFEYQGVKFYAYRTSVEGAVPVTVFFSRRNNDHVYTVDKNDYPYSQNGFEEHGVNFYAIKK